MPKRVLFVCLGNICRSPTAEGVARYYLHRKGLDHLVQVESAGTHGYHVGSPPDPRAIAAARQRGVDISGQRARRVSSEDFEFFDLVLAMDENNYEHLRRLCPPQYSRKLRLFMSYARNYKAGGVPDPYYGGADGFDVVLDMIEDSVAGLVEELTGE